MKSEKLGRRTRMIVLCLVFIWGCVFSCELVDAKSPPQDETMNLYLFGDKSVSLDSTMDRQIDENLILKIKIQGDKIVFDWDDLSYGESYDLQYNNVDGDVYVVTYTTSKWCPEGMVTHYEEPVILYENNWPMYFRLRMKKNDGTIWYSNCVEFQPDTQNDTVQAGTSGGDTSTNIQSDNSSKPSSTAQGSNCTIAKPKKVTSVSLKNQKSKKMIASWKKQKNVAGYQVQIATKSNFKIGKKTRNVYTNKLTWSGLKKGTTYYVRVRSCNYNNNGKKQYGMWSTVKKIRVKK